MKSLPRGPAGPGEVWPGAYTDAPRPRKGSNRLFQGFRRVGKAQASCFKVSEPSEKAQTGCFKVSEASERLKQVVSRFPRPRNGPNKLFQDFRGLGASGTPAKFAGYGLLRAPANFPASAEAVRDAPRPRKGQTGVCINHQRHEKSLIGGVVPMRLLKRDRPPRGGADQRNPVPCLPESRTSFMLAGSTRRRTPAG